jgi:2-phospho-L-lactate/phosphoenolpyruvate guanylyltransferase
MWAVVPLKNILQAKQRLAPMLAPDERSALMLAMVSDVLQALTQTPGLAGILLVSRAPEAPELARRFGTELYAEAAGADLSESVQAAGGYLVANKNARGTLIVPGDVPLITPADIGSVLADHQRLTLVPDSEGDGTNCIVSSPPNLIRYRFDGHSFKPHAEAAYGIGITPRIVRNLAFGIDVDTPRDLLRVLERTNDSARPSHTRICLDTTGISTRLAHPHNSSAM